MDTPGGVVVVDRQLNIQYYAKARTHTKAVRARACSLKNASVHQNGGVPEWLKGTGCKPVGYAYCGSNPYAPTIFNGQAICAGYFSSVEKYALLAMERI